VKLGIETVAPHLEAVSQAFAEVATAAAGGHHGSHVDERPRRPNAGLICLPDRHADDLDWFFGCYESEIGIGSTFGAMRNRLQGLPALEQGDVFDSLHTPRRERARRRGIPIYRRLTAMVERGDGQLVTVLHRLYGWKPDPRGRLWALVTFGPTALQIVDTVNPDLAIYGMAGRFQAEECAPTLAKLDDRDLDHQRIVREVCQPWAERAAASYLKGAE
jgi:hypothetical protein